MLCLRYLQHALQDEDRTKVLALLIHGDAAFIGQGVNAEVRKNAHTLT